MPSFLSASLMLAIALAPTSGAADNPIANSFRETASAHSKALLAAAQAMPAEKYGFSPTPAQRTFGQLVVHIVSDSRITCSAIAGVAAGPEEKLAASDPKERLVGALQSALAFCDSALAHVTDATLTDHVTYYDQPGLRVQALVGLVDDWADHYSQQAIYLRLNGILPPTAQKATMSSVAPTRDSAADAHDGQRDFDFELGAWAIHIRRLVHPLTKSNEWVSPEGYTHLVRKVWDGRASLAELENDRPSRHFDGLMLRLYNPESHQWSIYWGSSKSGVLDAPLVGQFRNGRGEFFVHDTYQGAAVLVRLVYSDITPTSFRTESSYSADGGTTWEPKLIQTFTREKK
jgi:DinB superfamily